MDIKLVNNTGYKWEKIDNIFYKGVIFYKDKLLSKQDIKKLFANTSHIDTLEKKLKEITGFFSIIIDTDNNLFLITDIIRTFPIFYNVNGNISDNAFLFCKNYNEFLEESVNEFLCAGFVTGPYTLLKNLYQVQSGEIVVINKATRKIHRKFYHSYITTEVFDKSLWDLKENLMYLLNKIINRLIKFANGNYIIVPLSGGFDSRLIVSLLRLAGYKNVICFTYGSPWSYDVRISEKVAKTLGYKWYYVEYNKKNISIDFVEKKWFKEYVLYANNLSSYPIIQDLFAVKYLVEKRLIPQNSIFVPGHTGDFLKGFHIKKVKTYINKNNIVDIIQKIHYSLCKNSNNLKERIKSSIDFNIENKFFYSVYENFNMKERQSKFIVNANRVYEFFGFKHYIPFWDREIVDFFKKVPLKYKIQFNLYDEVAKDIFKSLNINFKINKFDILINKFLRKFVNIDIVNRFDIFDKIFEKKSKLNINRKGWKNLECYLEFIKEYCREKRC